MKKVKEVRSDFIDDDNLQHIDCWFTGDDDEAGITVALVDLDTKKVTYNNEDYKDDELVVEEINNILATIFL